LILSSYHFEIEGGVASHCSSLSFQDWPTFGELTLNWTLACQFRSSFHLDLKVFDQELRAFCPSPWKAPALLPP
jgi:hypothetical protein